MQNRHRNVTDVPSSQASQIPQSPLPKSPSPIPEESCCKQDPSSEGYSDACSDVTDTSSDYLSESGEEASDDEGDLAFLKIMLLPSTLAAWSMDLTVDLIQVD